MPRLQAAVQLLGHRVKSAWQGKLQPILDARARE
jgi:hypothetical protein